MKRLILFIFIIFSPLMYSQQIYTFYIETNNYLDAPEFTVHGSKLVYSGNDSKEATFFSKYEILTFQQSFPHSKRERTLNFFTVSSYTKSLIDDIIKEFPDKYLMTEDITFINYTLEGTYTNDYGSTSPNTNLGVDASMHNYDYINLPKAWDFTKGNEEIVIGISDAKIDTSDVDFKFKTEFLHAPYQSLPYSSTNLQSFHGTGVSAIAAAQGDNAHGTVGICSNCSIMSTKYGNYDYLLELAQHGVRIINMSWVGGYSSINEVIIDELYEDYNVILIASAGNENPWDINPQTGDPVYRYPASYDYVISVTGINHKNQWGEETVNEPGFGEVSRYVEDQISPSVVTNYQGNGPYSFYNATLNFNDKVDICAPGYYYFRYAAYLGEGIIIYGSNTSASAPFVSGTVGLMLSVDECINNYEVDAILKLTSKNVEIIDGNQPYIGKIGSGKMETGDAVEFVYEMGQTSGNAVIDNHDFYRFDFLLNRINNKLTISNQKFRDKCTADFTARNIIDVLPGSDFKPNNEGFVDLKTDSQISTGCVQGRPLQTKVQTNSEMKELEVSASKLYPNPNSGSFAIQLGKELNGKADIEIYDIYGKLVHKTVANSDIFNVNIDNLSTGVYMVRLSYNGLTETIKFIRD